MKNVMLLGGITGAFAAIMLGIYIFSTNEFRNKLNIKAEQKVIQFKNESEDTLEHISAGPKLYFEHNTNYFKKASGNFMSEFNGNFKDSIYFYIPEKLRSSSY